MKQKDIITLIFVIAFSAVVSFFLSKTLISSPKNRAQSVEIVEPINADFPLVSEAPYNLFFNKNAVNPTQTITIEDQSNTKPFNQSQ